MEGPRAPKPQEFDSLLNFLNENLRKDLAWPINHEYPTALALNNIHNMSIITDEDSKQIVSHALVKPLIMKSPLAMFKLGAIGSVVTSPEFRNQGFSSQNIKNCLQVAKEQKCELVVLWTDQYDFYKKFGFEPAGFEFTYQLSDKTTQPTDINPDLKFMVTNKVDPQALVRLYNQHTVGCVRTAEDFQKYLAIPNSNIYTAWTKDNNLVAYAAEGKGLDLQNFIHDWAGSTPALLDLFNWVVVTQKRPTTIMAPKHSVNLRKQLKLKSDFEHQGVLGLVKILDFDSVAQKIKKAFRSEGLDRMILEKRGTQIIFGYNTDLYTLENESELVKLFFGPTLPTQFEFIKPETQKILETLLPLPMWIWGWDSI